MNKSHRLLFISLLFCAGMCIFSVQNASADPALAEKGHKVMAKLSSKGLEPKEVVLTKADSSVFFLNTTGDALLNIEVDFPQKKAHCWTKNVEFVDGKLRSTKPFGPGDFVLMCFPEKGTYPVRVQGLPSNIDAAVGQVIVR